MSMDRCLDCSEQVDTDRDDDCYVEFRGETICLCAKCREVRDEEDREERDCTCRARFAGPTDIDPPEGKIRDRNCPVHGVDPDDARDRQRDDSLLGDGR